MEVPEKTLRENSTVLLQIQVDNLISTYGEAWKFMETFSSNKIQVLVAQNIWRAHFGTAPTLQLVKEAYSYEFLISFLALQLEELNRYCGVPKKMSEEQLEELSKMIYIQCETLKVTEFHLFLINLKAGVYGEFFSSIDPMRITASFNQFLQYRNRKLAEYLQKEQDMKKIEARKNWAKNAVTRQEYEEMKKKGLLKKPKIKRPL